MTTLYEGITIVMMLLVVICANTRSKRVEIYTSIMVFVLLGVALVLKAVEA